MDAASRWRCAGSDRVRGGWEQQGFGEFSGAGIYDCSFQLGESDPEWSLVFPDVATDRSFSLNGVSLGRRGWSSYPFELPLGVLKTERNALSIRALYRGRALWVAMGFQIREGRHNPSNRSDRHRRGA